MAGGAYFCGDFHEITKVIGDRLNTLGRKQCLVVIVFANAKTEIFKEHIAPYLGEWHYRSEEFIEFVFPGYQGLGDTKDHDFKPQITANAFQDHVFVSAIEVFQTESGLRYSGEPTVVMCDATIGDIASSDPPRATLHLGECVVINLGEALRNGDFPSVPKLFDGFIDFARKNPDKNTVRNYSDSVGIQIMLDRLKNGLVKSLSKWLKLDDELLKGFQIAKYFAVRNRSLKKTRNPALQAN